MNKNKFIPKQPFPKFVDKPYIEKIDPDPKEIEELFAVVREGDVDKIKNFEIERHCNYNVQDANGNTVLHTTLEISDEIMNEFMKNNLIEFFLKKGCAINRKNNKGVAPIHLAFRNQYEVIIKTFINNGVDLFAKNNLGQNVLHYFVKGKVIKQENNNIVDLNVSFEELSEEISNKFKEYFKKKKNFKKIFYYIYFLNKAEELHKKNKSQNDPVDDNPENTLEEKKKEINDEIDQKQKERKMWDKNDVEKKKKTYVDYLTDVNLKLNDLFKCFKTIQDLCLKDDLLDRNVTIPKKKEFFWNFDHKTMLYFGFKYDTKNDSYVATNKIVGGEYFLVQTQHSKNFTKNFAKKYMLSYGNSVWDKINKIAELVEYAYEEFLDYNEDDIKNILDEVDNNDDFRKYIKNVVYDLNKFEYEKEIYRNQNPTKASAHHVTNFFFKYFVKTITKHIYDDNDYEEYLTIYYHYISKKILAKYQQFNINKENCIKYYSRYLNENIDKKNRELFPNIFFGTFLIVAFQDKIFCKESIQKQWSQLYKDITNDDEYITIINEKYEEDEENEEDEETKKQKQFFDTNFPLMVKYDIVENLYNPKIIDPYLQLLNNFIRSIKHKSSKNNYSYIVYLVFKNILLYLSIIKKLFESNNNNETQNSFVETIDKIIKILDEIQNIATYFMLDTIFKEKNVKLSKINDYFFISGYNDKNNLTIDKKFNLKNLSSMDDDYNQPIIFDKYYTYLNFQFHNIARKSTIPFKDIKVIFKYIDTILKDKIDENEIKNYMATLKKQMDIILNKTNLSYNTLFKEEKKKNEYIFTNIDISDNIPKEKKYQTKKSVIDILDKNDFEKILLSSDINGNFPIHYAIELQNVDIVKEFVSIVKIKEENNMGISPKKLVEKNIELLSKISDTGYENYIRYQANDIFDKLKLMPITEGLNIIDLDKIISYLNGNTNPINILVELCSELKNLVEKFDDTLNKIPTPNINDNNDSLNTTYKNAENQLNINNEAEYKKILNTYFIDTIKKTLDNSNKKITKEKFYSSLEKRIISKYIEALKVIILEKAKFEKFKDAVGKIKAVYAQINNAL